MQTQPRRPLAPEAVAAYKRAATLLLKDVRSDDPERARAAAERFAVLPWIEPHTPERVHELLGRLKHRNALDVVAMEAGADSWRHLTADAAAAEPEPAQRPTVEPAPDRPDRRIALAGLVPWSADEFEAGILLFHEYGGIHGDLTANLDRVCEVLEERYRGLNATDRLAHVHRFRMLMLWTWTFSERLIVDGIIPPRPDRRAQTKYRRLHEVLATEPFTASARDAGDVYWPDYDRVVARVRGEAVPGEVDVRALVEQKGEAFLTAARRGPAQVVLSRKPNGAVHAGLYLDGSGGKPAMVGTFGAAWADGDGPADLLRTLLGEVPLAMSLPSTPALFNIHAVHEREWEHRGFNCSVIRDVQTAERAIDVWRFEERPPLMPFKRNMPGATFAEAVAAAEAWAEESADARERAAAARAALVGRMRPGPASPPVVGDAGELTEPPIPIPEDATPERRTALEQLRSFAGPGLRLFAEILAVHGATTGKAAAYGPWSVTVQSEKGVITTAARWDAERETWVFADV